jgi:peptide/nickel transport system substrate-binding protein
MYKGRKLLHGRLALFALLAVLVLASACAPAAPAAPGAPADEAASSEAAASEAMAEGGGTLRVGLDVDAGTGDPRLARDTSALRLRELVFDGLIEIQPDFTPAPSLAESWENPDDLTWVFKLRPDVTFHNGDPLTAEDVKFTFDSILDETFASPNRSFYTPVTAIDVIDDLTVQFTLSEPYGPFLSYLNMPIVPKAVAEADPEAFAGSPVGTGPFRFVEWRRGDRIILEANPDYWDGAPLMDGVELIVVPDNSARVVALESGDLDLAQSPLSPQDVKRMEATDGFTVNRIPAAGYTYINLNCADPALSDVRVRQALSHLVNRQEILDTIYEGIGQIANGPIPPGMWAFTDDLVGYDYDPEAARALLDEAGWVVGADGIRSKDGTPLALTVRTHSEDPDRRQVVEVLQAVFSSEGIAADTNVVDWPTFFADVQAGNYQVGIVGWLNLTNPDQAFYRQFTEGGAANYGSCVDPQLDALIREARATLDQDAAKELYAEAARMVAENAFYIFLQYQEYIAVAPNELSGFVVNPVSNFRSLKDVSISR